MAECKSEVQDTMKVNEKTMVGKNERDKLTKILSNVFTIWTLNDSDAYFDDRLGYEKIY
jgi:hypothetical protein